MPFHFLGMADVGQTGQVGLRLQENYFEMDNDTAMQQ